MTVAKAQSLSREENLLGLADFCRQLEELYCEAGLNPANAPQLWRLTLSATCLSCGLRITGDQLWQVARLKENEHPIGRPGRLSRGYCGRVGCEGWTYLVEFGAADGLDWPKLLSESRPDRVRKPWGRSTVLGFYHRFPNLPRLAMVAMVLLLLFIAREWHLGGRIPIIREPENFKVDLAPQKAAGRCDPQPVWEND